MSLKHPDITSAELVDEPEGDGKIVVVLKVTTKLELDSTAPGYENKRVDALLAAVERYKSNNPEIDRVRLASSPT